MVIIIYYHRISDYAWISMVGLLLYYASYGTVSLQQQLAACVVSPGAENHTSSCYCYTANIILTIN